MVMVEFAVQVMAKSDIVSPNSSLWGVFVAICNCKSAAAAQIRTGWTLRPPSSPQSNLTLSPHTQTNNQPTMASRTFVLGLALMLAVAGVASADKKIYFDNIYVDVKGKSG